MNLLSCVNSVWENVKWAFDHLWAWIVYAFAFVVSFLGNSGVMYVHCLLGAIIGDFIFGVWKSQKQGQGFITKKAFASIYKALIYIAVMCLVHLADLILEEDTVICMKCIALIGVVTELWSMLSNLTIIYPQFAVFSIVQKFLLTTLSDKTNISEEELKENLDKVKNITKDKKNNPFTTVADFTTVAETEENNCKVSESVNGVAKDCTDCGEGGC